MQEANNSTEHSEDGELELTDISEGSLMTKKIAMAAIFGSLSIAIASVALIIPRMPWGVALFDPSSLFWLIATLLGGGWVGFVSMLAGLVGLYYFDPSNMFGPLMKFIATLPLILIPWIAVKTGIASKLAGKEREDKSKRGGDLLASPKTYLMLMAVAYVVRLLLMIPFNLILAPIIIPGIYDDFTPDAIIIITIIINSVQTVFDVVIPYIIIHRTKIFKYFRLW